MIPDLTRDGLLPAGVHDAGLAELSARFGTANERRRRLIKGIVALARLARKLGAKDLYVNGSFVTAKEHPGDWDGVLVVPVSFNAASPAAAVLADRAALRKRYHADLFVVMEDDGEIFNHYVREIFGKDRAGRPKGILRVRLKGEEARHGVDQE